MKIPLAYFPALFWLLILPACTGDTSEIDALYDARDISQETISGVKMMYSDSARVRLMVVSPVMVRREEDNQLIEEFPKGLKAEFYHGGTSPQSWLQARSAFRYPDQHRIVLRGNVQLYNAKMDKLETAELIWDEETQQIYTEKFVRITQPEKGDTTYGFGFVSDQHFNRFEIKRKFFGKIEEAMLEGLGE